MSALWTLAVAMVLAASASAETPDRARRTIGDAYLDMNAGALAARSDAEARASARRVLGRVLDYRLLARAALAAEGSPGITLSAAASSRYDALFRALLEARLTRLFRAGRAADIRIIAVDVIEGQPVVRTAVDDGKSRIRFDHVFRVEGEVLRIEDIVIDGYSQIGRYRQIFARWHRRGGEDYLLEKLSDAVTRAEGEADVGVKGE